MFSMMKVIICLMYGMIIINMKKIQKGVTVKDDQNYLEGINLITGDKIDYNRHMLSETQIRALCVDEKLLKIDKFMLILAEGEKIQKWSVFQNIMKYVQKCQAAEKIFTVIQKSYPQYDPYVSIMGEGICSFLKACIQNSQLLSKKCYGVLYRIIYQMVTAAKNQGSDNLLDWMESLTLLFRLPTEHPSVDDRNGKLKALKQFINGSFLMNTLPQRRKTALMMINALFCVVYVITNQQSYEIQEQAQSRIIFFNNDLNPSTRLVICDIIQKILRKNSQNPQLWKVVIDYYFKDKSGLVKQKSFNILSRIYSKSNTQLIFDELSNQSLDSQSLLLKFAIQIFQTYGGQLRNQRKYQYKVISFLNRLLRQNQQANLQIIFQCYNIISDNIMEKTLIQELQLKKFQLQNPKIIGYLICFYKHIQNLQFKEDIKKNIMKGLRYHEFDIRLNNIESKNFLSMLDCDEQQDLTVFSHTLTKQIENSKWKTISFFLDHILTIHFYQSQYQKVSQLIVKIYNNCPYFLLDKLHQVILYLILNDRKNLQLYQKIKDKFMSSRCWTLRRNYIKLYIFIKKNASHQFNRTLTQLAYKNILNQKISSIKMQFIKDIQPAYRYIDPNMNMQKMSIVEIVSRMAQDKDRELASMALKALKCFKEFDKDFSILSQNIQRNKVILEKQLDIEQVQSQTKKHIKTDKNIRQPSVETFRLKRGNLAQSKAPAKLITISNSIGKMPISDSKTGLIRSNSTQQPGKKQLSKLNLPIPKKRGKM